MESNFLPELQKRTLTRNQFEGLSDIPDEHEWFANLKNPHTKRAYQRDIQDFIEFVGLNNLEELRVVKRSHVIAYSDELELRGNSPATMRRKLSALSSLYQYLCNANAVHINPVSGVKRNTEGANQGNTPSLGDEESKALLNSPDVSTPKGLRDKAIIALFLHEGCRRGAVHKLQVKDLHYDQGVAHIRFREKREKKFSVMLHPVVQSALFAYLQEAGNRDMPDAPLFLSMKGKSYTPNPLSTKQIYNIIRDHGKKEGINVTPHALRATFITKALKNGAPIELVAQTVGHSDISTTALYNHSRVDVENSPVKRVNY